MWKVWNIETHEGWNTEIDYDILGCSLCETIEITLKNDALKSNGDRVGLYKKSSQVNGMVSWSSTSEAIWFLDSLKIWGIGSLANIGTDNVGIANNEEVSQCPFDLSSEDWMYYTWLDGWKSAYANEINLVCIEGKAKGKYW